MSFAVVTDTSANLPSAVLREREITAAPFSYYVDGREFTCTDTEAFDGASYYGAIREGTRVSTSLVSPGRFLEYFRPPLEKGLDLVYVGMSSGISGAYSCSTVAADQLRGEFPDRKIYTVDTLGASLGEGLLALIAADMRDEGKSAEETAERLEYLKVGMCQVFTVDDLMHLRHTGRLSNAKALIGTVLNIKPLLKGNENGSIVSFAKIRGRKRSVEGIAEQYDKLVENPADQVIGIAHADCQADAEYLISMLRRNNPPKDIMLVDYEPVTGSHVGPGALALFFFGNREFRSQKHL